MMALRDNEILRYPADGVEGRAEYIGRGVPLSRVARNLLRTPPSTGQRLQVRRQRGRDESEESFAGLRGQKAGYGMHPCRLFVAHLERKSRQAARPSGELAWATTLVRGQSVDHREIYGSPGVQGGRTVHGGAVKAPTESAVQPWLH